MFVKEFSINIILTLFGTRNSFSILLWPKVKYLLSYAKVFRNCCRISFKSLDRASPNAFKRSGKSFNRDKIRQVSSSIFFFFSLQGIVGEGM